MAGSPLFVYIGSRKCDAKPTKRTFFIFSWYPPPTVRLRESQGGRREADASSFIDREKGRKRGLLRESNEKERIEAERV